MFCWTGTEWSQKFPETVECVLEDALLVGDQGLHSSYHKLQLRVCRMHSISKHSIAIWELTVIHPSASQNTLCRGGSCSLWLAALAIMYFLNLGRKFGEQGPEGEWWVGGVLCLWEAHTHTHYTTWKIQETHSQSPAEWVWVTQTGDRLEKFNIHQIVRSVTLQYHLHHLFFMAVAFCLAVTKASVIRCASHPPFFPHAGCELFDAGWEFPPLTFFHA